MMLSTITNDSKKSSRKKTGGERRKIVEENAEGGMGLQNNKYCTLEDDYIRCDKAAKQHAASFSHG